MTLDTIAFAIEPFRQLVLAICSRPRRSGIEPVVDPIAFGIEMLVYARSSGIQAIIDSVPSCIQPPVNAIAATAVGAIISRSCYRTAKDQNAESYHNCFLH